MWRKPTEEDLVATLSREEIESYLRDFEQDSVPMLLDRAASYVRGYLSTNGNIRLSPNRHEIPEATISPAMDYLAIDVLKRLAIPATDERRDARKEAIAYFEKIATGKIAVESYSAGDDKPTGGACAVVIKNARPRVTSNNLEGL